MRLSLILCLITLLQTSAAVFSQKVSIDVKNQSMREVLRKIETQSQYRFFYNDQLSGLNHSVTLKADNQNVNVVLDMLLANQELSYKMLENNMIVIAPNEIAQQLKVTGNVTDAISGEALIGVSIAVEGTTLGTVSDMNGNFTIEVPTGNATLVLSYVGYLTAKVALAGKSSITVKLDADIKNLDEVVVVGYGVQKKKLVTGATVQVNGEQLEKLKTVNAFTALQSQAPGVNIISGSGQPGEGFKVTIRGAGTIGNAAPLYVIDGVPGGDLNNINPSDIESLDVLKDAASAAIYGARAANGVILVQTKKGKSGKIQVAYDGFYGVQNVFKMPPLLNAKEYMNVQDEINFNNGQAANDWSSLLGSYYAKIQDGTWNGTNWLDEIRNIDAPIQNHSLNIAGGNDMSRFSTGVSYTSQEGILGKPVQSKYERTTIRLNSEHVILRSNGIDVIKFGETLNYNFVTKQGIAIGNQYSNDISNMLRANPLMPKNNASGGYFNLADMEAMGLKGDYLTSSNPIADMVYLHGYNNSKNHNLVASGNIQIQPIRNLIVKTQINYKMGASSYRSYTPAYDNLSITDKNLVSTVTQSASSGWSYSWENTINYKFKINNHHFDVLAGQSIEKWGMGESMSATNGNLLFEDYQHAYLTNSQGIASGITKVSGSPYDEGSLASFFGRINYDWDEKYMASLIMRKDGSSNFASGHRWGSFPSVSVGWVISREDFLKSTATWLDFLKVRASWGQNGNCNIDNFQYLATVSFDATAAYSFGNNKDVQTTGGYANILPNPNVKWETSDQLNFGLDSRFLNSRLGVTFDYYKKTTKDWLVVAPILASYGTSAPYINGGDVENNGFELALNWNDHIKDFTYGFTVSMDYNKNKVTRIANTEKIIHGPANVLSQGTLEMFRAQVGYPIGYFYGYHTAGIFQNQAEIAAWKAAGNGILQTNVQPGDVKFVDTNHDGSITEADKGKIGDPTPHYNLGVALNFGYKGFDLSIATHGSFGQQIAKSYRNFVDGHLANYTTDVFNRWHGEGTSNKMPRLTEGSNANYQNVSDIYIENADYLKIQNITIGYDFKKLVKKMPFEQARLFVTAQNIYTFTNYSGMDPELGSNAGANTTTTSYDWAKGIDVGFYPNPRTFLMGVSLKF